MYVKLKLKDVFLREDTTDRTGRGTGAPAFSPPRNQQGLPPNKWPQHGQQGQPSSAASVTASQLQQKTMTQDDIDYWQGDPDDPEDVGASFAPPYLLNRDAYGNMKTATTREALRHTIRLMIESILDEDELEEDGEETSEVSSIGGGSIRGYTGPVGAKERDKDQDDVNEKSFGGGSYAS